MGKKTGFLEFERKSPNKIEVAERVQHGLWHPVLP